MSTYRSSTIRLTPSLDSTIGTLEGQQDALLAASCPLSAAAAEHLGAAIATPEVETRLRFADLTGDALGSLGYAFERVDGLRTTAFEARPANQPDRAHEVLLVVLDDDGKWETDHVGLVGETCNTIQRELVDEMELRGGSFDEDVNVQHHDPRGGSPVAIARAHDRTSLARGAVLAGDAGGSFTKSLYATTRATKDRALEGGRR